MLKEQCGALFQQSLLEQPDLERAMALTKQKSTCKSARKLPPRAVKVGTEWHDNHADCKLPEEERAN